ncbi:CopG family ribbon-helix-helix protein [Thiothrix fructosivorans]|uniref:Ribbon-helix-helix protein, CopG family n=2 Tax=Thiothrix fructosivorans TaxID=111770 RepID=A0A8B0SJR5_9GAMM|nr:ribbon-helix-helix protein, CopG family [Thiothrix fructosivorans]QTX11089.1 ribbon-helix-helix protein, CopG family [Thiothrix fructosivorans]
METTMRTLQMTFDDDLVAELDQVVQENRTNRSAFTREALRMAIALYHQRKLVEKHRAGYLRHPVAPDEFSVWEEEQAWGDE